MMGKARLWYRVERPTVRNRLTVMAPQGRGKPPGPGGIVATCEHVAHQGSHHRGTRLGAPRATHEACLQHASELAPRCAAQRPRWPRPPWCTHAEGRIYSPFRGRAPYLRLHSWVRTSGEAFCNASVESIGADCMIADRVIADSTDRGEATDTLSRAAMPDQRFRHWI